MIRAVARSLILVSLLFGGVAVASPTSHHKAKAHKVHTVKKARKRPVKGHHHHHHHATPTKK